MSELVWDTYPHGRFIDSGDYRILPLRGEFNLIYGQLWAEMYPTEEAAKARAYAHHTLRLAQSFLSKADEDWTYIDPEDIKRLSQAVLDYWAKKGNVMEEPEFYITEEGGLYHKWSPHIRGITVFAIFFPSGKVWDAYTGWRDNEPIEEVRAAYAKAQETVRDADV